MKSETEFFRGSAESFFELQAGGLLELRCSWAIVKHSCSWIFWIFYIWKLLNWSSVSVIILQQTKQLETWDQFFTYSVLLLVSGLDIIVFDEFSANSSWFSYSLIIWGSWHSSSGSARIFYVFWKTKEVHETLVYPLSPTSSGVRAFKSFSSPNTTDFFSFSWVCLSLDLKDCQNTFMLFLDLCLIKIGVISPVIRCLHLKFSCLFSSNGKWKQKDSAT